MELIAHIVCRPELAPALRLTGFPLDVCDLPDAALCVRNLADDPRVGMLLVDDLLFRALPPELMQKLDRKGTPIVTPLPAPRFEQAGLAEEYVLEILRQAIGYRVRPR